MASLLLPLSVLLLTAYVSGQLKASQLEYDYYADDLPAEAVEPEIIIPSRAIKGNFPCPERNGDFGDPDQCDKYWRCKNSVAWSLLCEDGLVFDTRKAGRDDPCDSPFVIDCGTKDILQEPSLTSAECPRLHGRFADIDPMACDVYYVCVNGVPSKTTCASPLLYNEKTGICNWAAASGRTGCEKPTRVSLNGFTCPDEVVKTKDGQKIPHPSYVDLEDCQKFYTCLNGHTPQQGACTLGQVFNDQTMLCDYPDNVPECTNWYQNDPRFADYYDYVDSPAAGSKSADPGAQDVAQ